jgi:hypothetical protein
MNWIDERQVMALVNFLLCSGIGWACLCRVSVMTESTTRWSTRGAYALMIGAATFSGLSPWFVRDWPGWAEILMSAAVLTHLLSTKRGWQDGVPEYAKSDDAPFDTQPGSAS